MLSLFKILRLEYLEMNLENTKIHLAAYNRENFPRKFVAVLTPFLVKQHTWVI